MKTVKIKTFYLHHKKGDVVEVRNQDAALLVAQKRAVYVTEDEAEGEDEEVQVKKAAKMTTKTVIKKK